MTTRKLSPKEAFYFFMSVGNFTGRSAASLDDFLKEIREVEAQSPEFHLNRGDFEKWTTDVLRDRRLALEIRNLRDQKLTGRRLRNTLYRIVSNRYRELKRKAVNK